MLMDTDKTGNANEALQQDANGGQTDVAEPATRSEKNEKKDKKKKENAGKTALRIIIAIIVIVVGIFLVLFFVAKAAKYDSIGSMLSHMGGELGLMWERITR
jgi:t-SNARE complex subunit (syntaxin)